MQLYLEDNLLKVKESAESYRWFYTTGEVAEYLGHHESCLYVGDGTYSCLAKIDGENKRAQLTVLLGNPASTSDIMGLWDFTKLPAHEAARVKELASKGQIAELIKIHDIYGLSPLVYCCGAKFGVLNYFNKAIETGLI